MTDERQATFEPVRVDLYVVLDAIVNQLGGYKAVGMMLRPDLRPEAAHTWCAHCCDRNRRENFNTAHIDRLFREAAARGIHQPKQEYDRALGYRPAEPMTPEERRGLLLREIQRQQAEISERQRRLEGLILELGEAEAKR